MQQTGQESASSPSGAPSGRPRDATIDSRATDAVVELLRTLPYGALTLERVAAAAGTSKPALRRRWKNLPGVVVHTLISVLGTSPTPDTGCLHCDLVAGISNLADAFRDSPLTHALPGLISDLEADPELREVFRERYFEARRATTRRVLDRAIDRGEIRAGLDMELMLDLLAAPLYYRALFSHQPVHPGIAEQTVHSVLHGIATRGWQHSHARDDDHGMTVDAS